MPMLYATDSIADENIYSAFVELINYTMTRDGQVLPVIVLTNVATAAATFTIQIETFDGSNSLGWYTYTNAKNPSTQLKYRIQLDQSIYLPSGFRVKVSIKSSNSDDDAVYGTCYLFDPNCASDVIAVEGQTLSSKVGDNFNTLFHNGNVTSTEVLADLATNDDVNDVVNVDTLIDGKTIVQALQIAAAILAGEVSSAGTGTEVFRAINDSADRVTVEVNAEGDRESVTYNV